MNHPGLIVAPGNIVITDVTTTSVSFTFDPIRPCLELNANITGYAVDYSLTSSLPFDVGVPVSNFSHTQTGLEKGASYYFEIYPVVDPALSVERTAPVQVRTLSGE